MASALIFFFFFLSLTLKIPRYCVCVCLRESANRDLKGSTLPSISPIHLSGTGELLVAGQNRTSRSCAAPSHTDKMEYRVFAKRNHFGRLLLFGCVSPFLRGFWPPPGRGKVSNVLIQQAAAAAGRLGFFLFDRIVCTMAC